MNEFLAELYGTQENIAGEDDFEKQAAAEFLVKLAAEEGVDLDSLSDAEVAGLLEEIEKGASSDFEDEAQEKLAEADFLGRAMAHAYVDELAEIEKDAATRAEMIFGGKGGRAGGEISEQAAKTFEQGVKAQRGRKAAFERATKGKMGAGHKGARGILGRIGKFHATGARQMASAFAKGGPAKAGLGKQLLERGKRFGIGASKFAPAAAVAGLGAYGLHKALKGKEKKSYNEAIEDAAAERAYEMLADAGYDIEKVAGNDVEIRALQMLEDAGYPVEWE